MAERWRLKHRARRGPSRGFTLVEILVVLAILTVLLAILLPVLAKVRDAAHNAKCLSNLRQIGQAFDTYAVDYRDFLPPESYPASEEQFTWVHLLIRGRYLTAPSQPDPMSTTSSGESVFRCPSGLNQMQPSGYDPMNRHDPVLLSFYRYSANGPGVVISFDAWYGLNLTAGDWSDPDGEYSKIPFRSIPSMRAPYPARDDVRLHRWSDFRHSSELAILGDGLLSIWKSVNLSARHGGGHSVNFLMADGHAETVNERQLPTTVADADANVGYPKFCLRR